MNWFIVYNTATGRTFSIGTVLADPMPDDLAVYPLTDQQHDDFANGVLSWDESSRTLIPTPPTPPPAKTAEEWLEQVGLGGNRQPTLLYLRQAGAVSPKLDATEQYLNQILAIFAADPAPRSDWPAAPFTFEETVAQAVSSLTPAN